MLTKISLRLSGMPVSSSSTSRTPSGGLLTRSRTSRATLASVRGGRFSVVCCRHLPAPADDDRPAAARSDGLAPERRDGADPDRRDGAAADVLLLPPPANPIALLDVVDWPCCPVVFGLWLMFAVPFLLRVRMTTR